MEPVLKQIQEMKSLPRWLWVASLVMAILFLSEIFSETPFLQHELIGQAFWWTQDRENFWNLLFDSQRTDCFPGRFRYVEYLLQAGYWKAMARGWLPRDLYDYASLVLLSLSSVMLFKVARRRSLSEIESLFLVALFLFSSHSYCVVLFNFRKAKVIASLLILILVYLSYGKFTRYRLWALTIFGVYTDPYWIMLAPLVAGGCDLSFRETKFPRLRYVLEGMAIGLATVFVVNNVIGVQFSPNARISFTSIPGKPPNFLNPENLPYFTDLLPEMVAPHLFDPAFSYIAWGVLLLFVAILRLMAKRHFSERGLLIAFLFALPVGAFSILPKRIGGYFGGYYGHTFMVLFLLAITDVLLFLKQEKNKVWLQSAYGVLLGILICHQFGKRVTFQHWQDVYSLSASAKYKAHKDYSELKLIRQHLKSDPLEPYVMTIDSRKLNRLYLSKGQYFDEDGRLERSDIAYLLIPAMFKKEFSEGKVKIYSY